MTKVILNLNNEVFLENLFDLDKTERNHVINTLEKVSKLDWHQLYIDQGLKWEKINSVTPPKGIDSIYSLRITKSRRATALRSGNSLNFLTIQPDHDSTYSKK